MNNHRSLEFDSDAIVNFALHSSSRFQYNRGKLSGIMSAKDIYHETVRIALEKDGWTITADPLVLTFTPKRQLKIDLGAELLISAERESQKMLLR